MIKSLIVLPFCGSFTTLDLENRITKSLSFVDAIEIKILVIKQTFQCERIIIQYTNVQGKDKTQL